MIELIYKGEKYNYPNVGVQNYDIETKMVIDKDATVDDVIEALAKLMNIATYRVSVETIRKACDRLEEEYGEDRIM